MGFDSRAVAHHKASMSSGSGVPWKLQWEKGYPYNIAILSPHVIDLLIHFQAGSPASLCDKMYSDDPEHANCEDCKKPGYQGKGLARPSLVKAMAGFVFDLVGKDRKTDSGTFKEHPEKIIEVSGGKGQVNFEKLNAAIATPKPYLVYTIDKPIIWSMKRLDEGGMLMPTKLPEEELEGLKLKLDALTQEILDKYLKRSRGEMLGMLLTGYGNLKKDELEKEGYVFPEESELGEQQDDQTVGEDPTAALEKVQKPVAAGSKKK